MFLADIFGYVLNFLYNALGSYGIAIIVFSIMLRVILLPLTINQQKSMKKSGKLQSEIQEIQRKYKNNPEKLNQETMELYKREKMSPFSGCFSSIIQIFIILSVFWLVSSPLTHMKNVQDTEIYKEYEEKLSQNNNQKASYKEIAMINLVEVDYQEISDKLKSKESEDNKNSIEEEQNEENINIEEKEKNVENTEQNENNENKEMLENKKEELEKLRINMDFLGLDLSKVPTQSLNDFRVYIIPVLYVISSFVSIKLTTNMQYKKNNENDKKENSEMDAMQNMSKGMTYMMPIMSVSIAIVAPLGLALYWLISNVLMILERIILKKIFDAKEDEENA